MVQAGSQLAGWDGRLPLQSGAYALQSRLCFAWHIRDKLPAGCNRRRRDTQAAQSHSALETISQDPAQVSLIRGLWLGIWPPPRCTTGSLSPSSSWVSTPVLGRSPWQCSSGRMPSHVPLTRLMKACVCVCVCVQRAAAQE